MKDKRRAIVLAALSVFQQKGLTGTRVEDICQEASIAKGTYYLYFSSLGDVAEAIFEQIIEDYSSRARNLLTDKREGVLSSEEALTIVLGEIKGLAKEAKKQLRLIPVLFSILAERMAIGMDSLNKRLGQAFCNLADAWSAILLMAGFGNVELLSRTIVSMLDGIILHAALFKDSRTELDVSLEVLSAGFKALIKEMRKDQHKGE